MMRSSVLMRTAKHELKIKRHVEEGVVAILEDITETVLQLYTVFQLILTDSAVMFDFFFLLSCQIAFSLLSLLGSALS